MFKDSILTWYFYTKIDLIIFVWVFESSKSDFLIFSYNFCKMTIESAQVFLTNQLNLGFGAFLRGLEVQNLAYHTLLKSSRSLVYFPLQFVFFRVFSNLLWIFPWQWSNLSILLFRICSSVFKWDSFVLFSPIIRKSYPNRNPYESSSNYHWFLDFFYV